MTALSTILENREAQAWLKQFKPHDQERAAELLTKMRLISRDEFVDELRSLITIRAAAQVGMVGLYAERELRVRQGVPNRLFKEANRKIRRAHGIGPQAVKPTRAYDPSVSVVKGSWPNSSLSFVALDRTNLSLLWTWRRSWRSTSNRCVNTAA